MAPQKRLSLGHFLPTRLDHARNVPFQRVTAETDAAQLESAHKAARPTAFVATIADSIGVFAMQFAINA
jgi:hypothetical protein